MRPAHRLIALAIVCSFAAAARAEGQALPTPPEQASPWTPPETRLPRFLVEAARTLFEQGLADPRSCEYRAIRVQVGGDRGGKAEVATSGWVLPADGGDKPRHAVAWSGLVYPVIAVGDPADLDADIRQTNESGNDLRRRGFNPVIRREDEAGSIELGSFHPIRVCLLLRLGRADLAEALWTAAGLALAPRPTGPGPALDLRSYGVSYLTLATDFAWFRHNRAVSAHLRGDDALALADSRALDAFWRAVDVKAAAMGFNPQPDPFGAFNAGTERASRYIHFLDQAPVLLADQERRASERANPPPPTPEGDQVAALIRALDQMGGGPGPGRLPIVNGAMIHLGGAADQSETIQKLAELGDAAVEPLILALRSDHRLTRSLSPDPRDPRGRTIMRVDQAAYMALVKVLKVTTFGPTSLIGPNRAPVDRNALADKIQKYWDENKNVPVVERWYRILADDQAGAAAWIEAAGEIVRPENAPAAGGGGGAAFVEGLVPPQPPGKPRLQGEPLREGHAPTVAELLIRRIKSVGETITPPGLGVNQAMQLAGFLVSWDPVGTQPALRELAQSQREQYARSKSAANSSTAQNLATGVAQLTRLRARAGDDSALAEYAEWLRTTSLDSVEQIMPVILEPLRVHPDDARLNAAADWLFNDPQSPWAALSAEKGAKSVMRIGRMLTASPALEIAAFRKLMQTAMGDQTIVGEAEIRGDGMVNVKLDDGSGMGGMTTRDRNDPDAPPAGAKAKVRACDLIAWRLATRNDAPYFNPCWPEPKRNAALAAMVEFLKRERP